MDENNSIPDMDFNQSYKDVDLIYGMLRNSLNVEIKINPLALEAQKNEVAQGLQGENARGAELDFTWRGEKYTLRVTYIFADAEFDQTFHQATLLRDGEEVFSTRATCRNIVNQVLEAVKK